MLDDKIVDTSWEMKWKRSLRKRLINCLARIENDGKPTQELAYEMAKAKECFVYWNSDTAMWEKHKVEIPTQSKDTIEQQYFCHIALGYKYNAYTQSIW